jgi:glycosyltransferase involved in cell wall biosynthesis
MKLLDDKYTLRIAGGKNKDGKKIIQNLIKKYNINPKRVNYLGYIDNDHVVSAVLDNSNALLLPLGNNLQSKYFTSPMKLFEYMSTSIPVVAVKYPSITSIVRNDEVYLAENTPFDFSEKIRQACEKDNDEMIDNMNNLVKNYSYENRSHKLNNFIRSNKS